MAERIEILNVVEALGGPRKAVLDGGPNPAISYGEGRED